MEETTGKKSFGYQRMGIILAVIAAVTVFVLVYMMTNLRISLEPVDLTPQGIAPDTSFALTVSKEMTVDELYKKISFEPEAGFELRVNEKGGFFLKPFKPLPPDTEVKIKIAGKTFAYQVRNALVINSTFPANNATKVPSTSGLEFNFNVEDIDLETFMKSVTVSPQAKADFNITTTGEGRFVLFSKDKMQYDTQYTITIGKDLTSQSGAVLEKDVVLTFKTVSQFDEETEYLFNISDNLISNVIASETPLVKVSYISENMAAQDVAVKLYKYSTMEEYAKAVEENLAVRSYKYSSFDVDTKTLAEYASFSLKPMKIPERYSDQYMLQFPEALPEGWYVVEFTVMFQNQPVVRQMLMQSTSLSVFKMTEGNDNMVLWVNDTTTGLPVEGAKFEATGVVRASGTTDAQGVAQIKEVHTAIAERGTEQTYRFTVTAGDRTFVDFKRFYTNYAREEGKSTLNPLDYYSYMFMDRPLYRTTDTIQVWGMVRPRSKEIPAPTKAILQLGNDTKQEVVIGEDGTFAAKISIENFISSYTGLSLKLDEDTQLRYEGLRIEDFVKPLYTAETSAEKPIYLKNEDKTAYVTMDISTFDGTPVSDFKTQLLSYDDRTIRPFGGDLFTDANGHIRAGIDIIGDYNSWYPISVNYRFSNNDAESENFYVSDNLYLIFRDLMIKGKPDTSGTTNKVEITTNRIDISKVKSSEDIWRDGNILKGEPVTENVTVKLHDIYYVKERLGTTYDFINRVSVENYEYKRQDEVIEHYSLVTNGGKFTLEGLPKSDDEHCYYLEIIAEDSKSQVVVTETYLGNEQYRSSYGDGSRRYTLNKKVNQANMQAQEAGDGYRFSDNYYLRSTFTDGEDVTFLLEENDRPIKDMKGRMLYSVVQKDLGTAVVTDQSAVMMPFAESLVPNYTLAGAYFDGKHVFAMQEKRMSFDPKQRELEIELKTDKEQYRPAENATVTATVKDKTTGLPAANTTVVLSVVDEAIFALEGQEPNILAEIFESIYFPSIDTYVSYNAPDYGGAGEKGGGGDGGMPPRSDFKDTAYFSHAVDAEGKAKTYQTDQDGKVQFTFALPDNITAWRLTAVALDANNHAGDVKSKTVATKEYFVMPIINETLLAGDSVAVGLRSAGVGVTPGDAVKYTVTITGNGVNQTKNAESTLRAYVPVSFDTLANGEYKVMVKGECKTYSDAVEIPFKVTDSGIEISLVKRVNLKGGLQVDPLRYPVSISLFDQNYKTYNEVFRSVSRQSYGNRADMRLARKYLAQEYEKEGVEWYNDDADADITDLQRGMIQVLPLANPNIELTVMARLAMPSLVPDTGLYGLGTVVDYGFEGSKAAVYLAQAMTASKATTDLEKLLSDTSTLDYKEKSYVAAALFLNGNDKAAKAYYDKAVKANIKEIQGGDGTKAYYVEAQGKLGSEACTGAASFLATLMQTEEMDGLVLYLSKVSPEFEPYILERVLYLDRFNREAKTPAKFSYDLDGATQTITLDRGTKHVTLNKEQLAKANFRVDTGEVYADIYYAGAPKDVSDNSKKIIPVSKTIIPIAGKDFKRGDLVQITLSVDLSQFDERIGNDSFVLEDYIPSGMRFEKFIDKEYGNIWYFNKREGQRVQFQLYPTASIKEVEITYYARCSSAGEYIVESAYVNNCYSDIWGASDRSKVTIHE